MLQSLLFFLLSFGFNLSLEGQICPIEKQMQEQGLVNITDLAPAIAVDLKYSSTDNFVGRDMYGRLERAYLERGFAQRIAKAQELLAKKHKGYRFIIYDASRPMSVQKQMRALVEGTPLAVYVAEAKRGGRHNYGVAVDISILDDKGKALDMGTPFDHFGWKAHTGQEELWLKEGKISREVWQNRKLLRSIMSAVGLRPYRREWWHYQERLPMSEVRKRYKRLDF